MSTISHPLPPSRIYKKPKLVSGRPTHINCVDIADQTYVITGGPLAIVSLEDEWYEDQHDPQGAITALQNNPFFRADIFTFWQRLPSLEPKYPSYPMEWEEIAVLPIKSYDHWWTQQIKPRVRTLIRKSEKEGVSVRETSYNDDFVRGMTAIFNESPVRQGRKFWHYGKDFEVVKQQFSRYIHRERMIGAYYKDEMIGFIMLGDAGGFGLTGQIISSIRHRDKSPNNALIAKAVEICERQKLDYLCYLYWSDDSLAEFKRRCGFVKMKAPRYFVPLTARGHLALKCGAHRGWKHMIPPRVKAQLKRIRRMWNSTNEE